MDHGIQRLDKIEIWEGLASAEHISFDIENGFYDNLSASISSAVARRRQRRKYSSAKALLNSISLRGIQLESEHDPDQDDIKGLVGEMIASELLVRTDREPIFTKWQYGGTSKSKGIDVLGRERGKSESPLYLLEAKHLHEEVRASSRTSCCASIRGRMIEGLAEFEETRLRLNIAGILVKLRQAISALEATNTEQGRVREIFDYLSIKLEESRFNLDVLVCLDSKYCSVGMLSNTVSTITDESGSGDHVIVLAILQVPSLEEKTDEWCNLIESKSD